MIKLELPIYTNTTKKKTVLISMNWYRNAHFQTESKVKKILSSTCVCSPEKRRQAQREN